MYGWAFWRGWGSTAMVKVSWRFVIWCLAYVLYFGNGLVSWLGWLLRCFGPCVVACSEVEMGP